MLWIYTGLCDQKCKRADGPTGSLLTLLNTQYLHTKQMKHCMLSSNGALIFCHIRYELANFKYEKKFHKNIYQIANGLPNGIKNV